MMRGHPCADPSHLALRVYHNVIGAGTYTVGILDVPKLRKLQLNAEW